MKSLIAILVLAVGVILTASVVSANPDNGQDAPPCHGANEEECRDDPQPDNGRDCYHSDDHVCVPTSTPTTVPPTNTPTATVVPPTNTPVPTVTVVQPTPTTTVPEFKSPQNPTPTVAPPVIIVPPVSTPATVPAQVAPPVVVPQRLPASGSGGYLPAE